MAPLSHLLVYYVRENGEGVTDSVQIPVQPDFENQVCFIPKLELFLMSCSVGAIGLNAPGRCLLKHASICPKLLLWWPTNNAM